MHTAHHEACIAEALQTLDAFLTQHLHADEPTIEDMCQRVAKRGGKKIRAKIVLWTAKHFAPQACTQRAIQLAAIVELLHAATLLHDDVIDQASTRRHQPAAHHVWGNKCAILGGDFLYGLAFQEIAKLQHPQICQTIANATTVIIEGEVQQLMALDNMTMDQYFDIINYKTAKLFEVAAQTAAMLCQASEADINGFAKIGHHLGMAFQMIDDLKDYFGDPAQTGKTLGTDFIEGKVTLPILCTLSRMSSQDQQTFKHILAKKSLSDFPDILATMQRHQGGTHALEHCHSQLDAASQLLHAQAPSEAQRCLRHLVDSLTQQATLLVQDASTHEEK